MKKEAFLAGVIFVIVSALLLVYSPDTLTFLFLIIMIILMACGYLIGIYSVSNFSRGFKNARGILEESKSIETNDIWLVIEQRNPFFSYRPLDKAFNEYRIAVKKDRAAEYKVLSPIESYISESAIALLTWRGVITQIPNTLTGIGILGTFVGLVIGIGNIGFSSVAVAMSSLESLVSGIEIAFYTSISGVIFSIIFNLFYKLIWNIMLRDMQLFISDFHKMVIPGEDEQLRMLQCRIFAEEEQQRREAQAYYRFVMERKSAE